MNYSVTKHVNTFYQKPISIREVLVATFTFKEIPTTTANTILVAKRYNDNDDTDAGLDVSTLLTVATNVATLSNIWIQADTPAIGRYRIMFVLQDTTSDPANKQEVNYIVPVID